MNGIGFSCEAIAMQSAAWRVLAARLRKQKRVLDGFANNGKAMVLVVVKVVVCS